MAETHLERRMLRQPPCRRNNNSNAKEHDMTDSALYRHGASAKPQSPQSVCLLFGIGINMETTTFQKDGLDGAIQILCRKNGIHHNKDDSHLMITE